MTLLPVIGHRTCGIAPLPARPACDRFPVTVPPPRQTAKSARAKARLCWIHSSQSATHPVFQRPTANEWGFLFFCLVFLVRMIRSRCSYNRSFKALCMLIEIRTGKEIWCGFSYLCKGKSSLVKSQITHVLPPLWLLGIHVWRIAQGLAYPSIQRFPLGQTAGTHPKRQWLRHRKGRRERVIDLSHADFNGVAFLIQKKKVSSEGK